MRYWVSNGDGHMIDDVTWPPKGAGGSTVGYSSDSLAYCWLLRQGDGQTDAGCGISRRSWAATPFLARDSIIC